MPIRIVLSVFSCRRNPEWMLPSVRIPEMAALVKSLPVSRSNAGSGGGLGYSGFVVDPEGEESLPYGFLVCDGVVDRLEAAPNLVDTNRTLERWLLATATRLDPVVLDEARVAIASRGLYRDVHCKKNVPSGTSTLLPKFSLNPWNQFAYQLHDNCYNYANDLLYDDPSSGEIAQPGQQGGSPCTKGPSCACQDYTDGAIADALVASPDFVRAPGMSDKAWFVALFVNPPASSVHPGDCHWYRQDNNGFWSHKPGAQKVRSCDESGKLITDPRTANTLQYKFCGFFVTGPGVAIS